MSLTVTPNDDGSLTVSCGSESIRIGGRSGAPRMIPDPVVVGDPLR
jgi:hypothetical protein